ncbi:Oidioi.mRNA.OKI2018_I69.chr2.g5704.t1.cds [Oikopleura dioica]|uniref:Oidioi.mRNA.OKI2018_I69.chr2.g5704.t1.cds n=1 Tax=Oikopleura dioica TaxID=34765 RepID=A0ABN7T4Q4_OIKDI|nr:Oidioi.mRNA.OKI2018_I69.chr2.g5704.t1.cds [Oikopleura dioica]
MGHKSSKLSEKKMKLILSQTKFTEQEILNWHRGFLVDCPTGALSRSEFSTIYSIMFPNGDISTFTQVLFDRTDINNDGHICFVEFISTMSVMARGSLHERLTWLCEIFDQNGDGILDKSELIDLIKAMVALTGGKVCQEAANDKANEIWKSLKKESEIGIPMEDFVKATKARTLLKSQP